jgi:hypothetical protein
MSGHVHSHEALHILDTSRGPPGSGGDRENADEAVAISALYRRRVPADFSRDVLAARPKALGVIPIWGVSWSDLGSPARVLRVRRQLEPRLLGLAQA